MSPNLASPTPTMPAKGHKVSITLDSSGYVRKVEPAQPAPVVEAHGTEVDERQHWIIRQSVLKTAAEIATSGNRAAEVKSVLAIAAELESWVTR